MKIKVEGSIEVDVNDLPDELMEMIIGCIDLMVFHRNGEISIGADPFWAEFNLVKEINLHITHSREGNQQDAKEDINDLEKTFETCLSLIRQRLCEFD